MGSHHKPQKTKSLDELKSELEGLKAAKDNITEYKELEAEERKVKAEIKREGFQLRHRKALAIIGRAKGISRSIGNSAAGGIRTAGRGYVKYGRPVLKKSLKGKKLAKYV